MDRRREHEPLSSFEQFVRQHGEQTLLKGSHFEGSMKEWRKQREVIGELLKDGTVLDVGCANGFLMACLEEWSGKSIDAFGVDQDPEMIQQARKLFPNEAGHFVTNAELEDRPDFPLEYDNVYWNVWDDFELTSEEGRRYLERLSELVKSGDEPGVYILGSYRPEREDNLVRLQELKDLGWEVVRVLDMSEGRPEIVMEIKRKAHGKGNDGTID